MNMERIRCKKKCEKKETLMQDTIGSAIGLRSHLYWFDVVLDQRVVCLCLWGWFGFVLVQFCVDMRLWGTFGFVFCT